MLKKILFTFLLFFGYFVLQSQEVSGKIMNKNSLKPIDKVAIVTNLNKGSVSNKTGDYKLQIKNVKSVTFSCLGFASKTINIQTLKKQNYIVYLVEDINLLDEIQLNLSKISLDSLLIKAQKSMQENYISGATKNHFYAREKTEINFKKLELDLDKSTLLSKKNKKLAEEELANYSNKLKTSNPIFSSEFVGTLSSKEWYSKKMKKSFRINNVDSVLGITFMNTDKNITIEKAQSDLQNVVLKYLDTNKSYKVSSGLFKIEDSLSLKEIIEETDSLSKDDTFSGNRPSDYFNDAIKKSVFFKKNNQNNFFDRKYYNHSLEKNQLLGNKIYYSIKFVPRKSKSKFSGNILVNPKDFTIKKIEYEYADGKRGQNINLKWLLGIKMSENIRTISLYYEKNKDDKMYLSYYKKSKGTYAYVHRPIKFRENSKQKHKIKFDIKIELDTKETTEILIKHVYNIDESTIKPIKKENLNKRQDYITIEEYNKLDWKNRQYVINYLKKYE